MVLAEGIHAERSSVPWAEGKELVPGKILEGPELGPVAPRPRSEERVAFHDHHAGMRGAHADELHLKLAGLECLDEGLGRAAVEGEGGVLAEGGRGEEGPYWLKKVRLGRHTGMQFMEADSEMLLR